MPRYARQRFFKAIKRYLAARRLARMVEERRNSFECQDYRRRRAAALRGTA